MLPRRLAWIVKKWMNDVTCTLILTKEGKLSLDEYLDRVVFYQNRPFKA